MMQQLDFVQLLYLFPSSHAYIEEELHNYRLESQMISYNNFVTCQAKLYVEWEAVILGVVTFYG